MNEILRAIYSRKSVRAFLDRDIPSDAKQAVLDAALQAPSAGNMTLYTIIDVTDKSLKERLAVTCDNQPFIAKAPMVLIFCADMERWYRVFCKYTDNVRKPSVGDLQLASVDAVIAAQNAVVAAESMGIGSCYIGDITENFEIHRELLGLPKYVLPVCMLVFGYPTEQQTQRPKPPRFTAEDIVHENSYSTEKADIMGDMLMRRQSIPDEEALGEYVRKFCERKHNSDFSVEMSRSCEEMLRSFCEE